MNNGNTLENLWNNKQTIIASTRRAVHYNIIIGNWMIALFAFIQISVHIASDGVARATLRSEIARRRYSNCSKWNVDQENKDECASQSLWLLKAISECKCSSCEKFLLRFERLKRRRRRTWTPSDGIDLKRSTQMEISLVEWDLNELSRDYRSCTKSSFHG